MRRIQVEITQVEKLKVKTKSPTWEVQMKSASTGRHLHMETTRAGYCVGQVVKLTCEKVDSDGQVINPRFSAWVPILFPRKKTRGEQIEILTNIFTKFRNQNGYDKSSGRIRVEGGFQIAVDARGWFILYHGRPLKRLRSFVHARSLAKSLVEERGQCQE